MKVGFTVVLSFAILSGALAVEAKLQNSVSTGPLTPGSRLSEPEPAFWQRWRTRSVPKMPKWVIGFVPVRWNRCKRRMEA